MGPVMSTTECFGGHSKRIRDDIKIEKLIDVFEIETGRKAGWKVEESDRIWKDP